MNEQIMTEFKFWTINLILKLQPLPEVTYCYICNPGSLEICDTGYFSRKLEICYSRYINLSFSGDTSTRGAISDIIYLFIYTVQLFSRTIN